MNWLKQVFSRRRRYNDMQKHNFRIALGPRGIWLTTLDAFRALAA